MNAGTQFFLMQEKQKLERHKQDIRRWKAQIAELEKRIAHDEGLVGNHNAQLQFKVNALKKNIEFAEIQIHKLNRMGIR